MAANWIVRHGAMRFLGEFDADGRDYQRGADVVVRTDRGLELGHVLCEASPRAVQMLAGKRLFPEYLRSRLPAEAIAGHVLHWLEDPAAYREVRRELAELRERVAEPGACDRAAAVVLEALSAKREVKRAG